MKKQVIARVLTVLLGLAFCRTASAGAGFTLGLPPLPFPPKILQVTDSGAQIGGPMTVTVRAQGEAQRKLDLSANPPTNFCDSDLRLNNQPTPNPPLVLEGYIWYTDATVDEQLANWTKVTMSVVGNPTDPAGCDHPGTISELTGQIPEAAMINGREIVYYVQVIDTFGNIASQTPDDQATTLPQGASDLQTLPALAAKAPKGTNLVNDAQGDTKGNAGQPISKPTVDILGVNIASGTTDILVNLKLAGTSLAPDGGEIEGFVGAFINADAVDDDPNDALYPQGTYALSTAFQEILPDLVHAVWDGRCLTNVAVTGGSTDDLIGCNLYAGGAGTGMIQVDGSGFLNWKLAHSSSGVSLLGPSKGITTVFATGQIDIAASSGPPFWITDFTSGLTYYNVTQRRVVSGTILPKPAPSGISVEKSSAGSTDTCTISWVNASGLNGGSYIIYTAPTANAGGNNFPNLQKLTTVPQGTEGATNTHPHTGRPQDGARYFYWVMPKDADGRTRVPPGGGFNNECTHADCPFAQAQAPWPGNSTIVCQTTDLLPPDAPTNGTAATADGATRQLTVNWEPGPNASDPSMQGQGTGYNVYRDDGTGEVPIGFKPFVAGLSKFELIDSNLENGKTYTYRVEAKDVGQNVSATRLTITGTPQDKEPPPRPENTVGLNRSTEDSNKVQIRWEFIPEGEPDSRGFDLKEYVVYRCDSLTEQTGSCSDGNVPLTTGTWNVVNCAPGGFDLSTRGSETEQPSCEDTTGLTKDNYYHYVVTAKDHSGNESSFPDQNYSETGYPFRAVRVQILIFPDNDPPGKVRDVTAQDTKTGGSCAVSFKMPLANQSGAQWCAKGGTQPYCSGDTDINGFEIAEYFAVAGTSDPTSTAPPYCGSTANVGTLATPDGLITLTCAGLTNGTAYKINVFAQDQKDINKGPLADTAASCTPTDTIPPDVPTGGRARGIADASLFYVGWNATGIVAEDGFNVYVCAVAPGGTCATGAYQKVNETPLTPAAATAACADAGLTGVTYCFEDSETFFKVDAPLTKFFNFKVTARDASGNETALADFEAVGVDFSIAAAEVNNCFTTGDEQTGNGVTCTWATYDNAAGAANLVLVGCAAQCTNAASWVEYATVATTVNQATIAPGTLASGNYSFAVLGKVDATNKSNPLAATKFGPVAVVGPAAPSCESNCVNLNITGSQGGSADVEIIPTAGGDTCLMEAANGAAGKVGVQINTSKCSAETKVDLKLKNVPGKYLADASRTFICKRDVALSSILDGDEQSCALKLPSEGGDANGDNRVNLQDLGVMKQNFNSTTNPDCDFNGDGRCNLQDLGIIKIHFGLQATE